MPVTPPTTWDRTGLEAIGLVGFVPLVGLTSADVPREHGIYVVLRADDAEEHRLRAEIPILGRATYTVESLAMRWIEDSSVVQDEPGHLEVGPRHPCQQTPLHPTRIIAAVSTG